MRRLPFGYCMVWGRVAVDEAQAARLRAFFAHYLSGLSISRARRAAGITLSDKTCRAMLLNRRYLGDGRFPRILDEGLLDRAAREAARRGRHLVGKTGWKRQSLPIRTVFTADAEPPRAPEEADAAEYAARLYAAIRCGGKAR